MSDLSEAFASLNVERMTFQSRKNPVPKNKHPRPLPVSARGSMTHEEEDEPLFEREEDIPETRDEKPPPPVSARIAEADTTDPSPSEDSSSSLPIPLRIAIFIGIVLIINFLVFVAPHMKEKSKGNSSKSDTKETTSRGEEHYSAVSTRAVDRLLEYV